MRRKNAGSLIALALCVAGLVRADSGAPEVVTNPTPAVSATMTFSQGTNGCFTWNVRGKVKAHYRGHGANVKLLCMLYADLGRGGTGTVFPPSQQCDGDFCQTIPPNVDACGNFSFDIQPPCGTPPQLDNHNFCTFIVHIDDSKAPQACNKPVVTDGDPEDPNGSAPCSGGYCPNSP